MQQIGLRVLALALLFSALASPARAEPSSHIQLDMAVVKEITVKDATGAPKVELVEPKIVVPGDEVIYRITYTNVGKEPTTSVVVTNRIPEHMTYVRNTAQGANTDVLFSVDGTLFAPRERLTVRTPEGEERPATEQELAFIRWVVNLAVPPGAGGTVSYRARLL